MAYAFVQSAEGTRVTSGSTISATYSSNNGTGNLLVAVIGRSSAATGPPSVAQVTDGVNYWKQAVEWTTVAGGLPGSPAIDIWFCESAGGGPPVTVTATLSSFPVQAINGMNMIVLEYSGNSGTELIDQIGQAVISTTSVTVTTNYNLVGTGDLLISAVTGNMTAATVPSLNNSRLADTTQKFWVADLVGPSSGAQASAAWTGLTGGSAGAAVIVCFKLTGNTSGPTLLQSSYSNAAYPVASPLTSWTSQAFPINPIAGHTLVALVSGIVNSPFGSTPALTATSSVSGDTWTKLGDSGVDQTSGVNLALFACSPTLGGSSYTITVTFPFKSAGFSCLLLEFSGFNCPVVVDQGNGIAAGAVSTAWTISTPAAVVAGDLAIAAVSSLGVAANAPASGWTQMLCDSNGVGYGCYQTSTTAGTLTSTWTRAAIAGTDMVLSALKGATGPGAH